jgi:ATP-dependent Lon protease
VSLFSQQTVAPNIAMTGEVTLRGNVLAIGGVKEKVIAAHRAGIKTVLLPQRNRKEVVHDLPENVRQDIHFVYARTMWDVLREVWPEYLRNKPSLGISSRL